MTRAGEAAGRRGIDRLLTRQGYAGTDLQAARRRSSTGSRSPVAVRRRRRAGGRGDPAGRRRGPADRGAPPGPGQVTVEMVVSAISPGTERAQWLRLPNAQPALPFRPGYSGVGRVLAVGAGSRAAVGDLVAVPRAPHASVATVPAGWVVPVPDGVPLEEAAQVYLAIISGYGVRRAALPADGPVCVVGTGTIGALAARLAAGGRRTAHRGRADPALRGDGARRGSRLPHGRRGCRRPGGGRGDRGHGGPGAQWPPRSRRPARRHGRPAGFAPGWVRHLPPRRPGSEGSAWSGRTSARWPRRSSGAARTSSARSRRASSRRSRTAGCRSPTWSATPWTPARSGCSTARWPGATSRPATWTGAAAGQERSRRRRVLDPPVLPPRRAGSPP